jgi:hypothetical protein
MRLSFPVNRNAKITFWSVFIIGLANRIAILRYNTRSTDDFIEPVQLWIKNGAFPHPNDCWECFQPPLFSTIVKHISDLLGYSSRLEIFTVIQGVNLLVGGVILLTILLFIANLKLTGLLNFSMMLFWALNPELISINVLATNDNFSILAGILLTFLLVNFNRSANYYSLLLALALVVGLAIKGNVLVFLPVVVLVLVYRFVRKQRSIRSLAMMLITFTGILVGSFYGGGYYFKYQRKIPLFSINQEKRPAPHLMEVTPFDGRPGVESIASAYFTFYYASLFKQPYNNYDFEVYPKHRTSFFTQLYAQFSDYFFERHTWIPPDTHAETLAKNNFVVQLPLLLFFIIGFVICVKESIQHGMSATFIYVTIFIGYISFLMLYTYQYRIFTAMKLIYILPAIYSFIYILHKGIASVKIPKLVSGLLLVSCIIYLVQTYILVTTLAAESFVMP